MKPEEIPSHAALMSACSQALNKVLNRELGRLSAVSSTPQVRAETTTGDDGETVILGCFVVCEVYVTGEEIRKEMTDA